MCINSAWYAETDLPDMVRVFASPPFFWAPSLTYAQPMGDLWRIWGDIMERNERLQKQLNQG